MEIKKGDSAVEIKKPHELLKESRIKKGLSQNDVARRIGKSQPFVWSVENSSDHIPSYFSLVLDLCKGFETDPKKFIRSILSHKKTISFLETEEKKSVIDFVLSIAKKAHKFSDVVERLPGEKPNQLLRRARIYRGITQQSLAYSLFLTRGHIGSFESLSKNMPSNIGRMMELCNVLGIDRRGFLESMLSSRVYWIVSSVPDMDAFISFVIELGKKR